MPTYPLTYLVCPECEQIHYFRAVPIKEGTLIRYNHPQDPDDPTNFNTDCLTCHAMQENDQPTSPEPWITPAPTLSTPKP